MVPLDMKGNICPFVKWQIHPLISNEIDPFISKERSYIYGFSKFLIELNVSQIDEKFVVSNNTIC